MSDLRSVPLSVLDLAPIPAGGTAAGALRATIDLAQRAEELGYQRFWVAEHHNMPGIASSAPPVLIGHLAAATSRIHVGSGGVMLPNHVSLVVAEQFGMLEALHPGRIDLGIGRAPGTDPATAAALRRSPEGLSAGRVPRAAERPDRILQRRVARGSPVRLDHRGARAGQHARPCGCSARAATAPRWPGCWGCRSRSRTTSARPTRCPRWPCTGSSFRPSAELAEPHAMIAANVICAETDERAQYLAGPSGLSFLRLRTGRPGPLPSPEEAAAYPYTELDREIIESRRWSAIVGAPDTVRRGLAELLDATDADELMITAQLHDPADRVRSLELVAEIAAQVKSDAPVAS